MILDAVDEQIYQVFGLLAVLLVFVFAFVAALIPQFAALLDKEPGPADDRKQVRRQMTVLQLLFSGNVLAAVAVFCVLVPLTSQVIASLRDEASFPTTKASMLLAVAFLLVTIVAGLAAISILQVNKPAR